MTNDTPQPDVSSWCNFLYDYPDLPVEGTVPNDLSLPVSKQDVRPQQPLAMMRQSIETNRPFVPIPTEIKEIYDTYRPTPFRRARKLEARLQTSARLYYKYEGANISGSHKLNTAIAQAYYYKKAGAEHLVTGTGAGQWGTALAYACRRFDLACTVFMVGISYRQKPQRRELMNAFGATVIESPSWTTDVGRQAHTRDVDRLGSLATATGEALELARSDRGMRFAVGSGENCVLLHQTVIGVEALQEIDFNMDFPTHVVACMGAGSNFGGFVLPFMRAAKERGKSLTAIAAEPSSCPKLTKGIYAFDVNDFSGTTPVTKMYTLGRNYLAPPIHAGGLRYHGTSTFLSALYAQGEFEARAVSETSALSAGLMFAETEGILPAPESAHAIAVAIDIAQSKGLEEPSVVLVNISGHGLFDLSAYNDLREGNLRGPEIDEIALQASLVECRRYNDELLAKC